MRSRHIRIVVLLGAIAIIGIIAMQAYFMKVEWGNKEKQFSQTVTICLRNVASKLHKIENTTPASVNPVRQLSSNYFVVDVNGDIDANILEYYLKTEFARYNILTDFEYAIYNCQTNQMVYGNYIFYNGKVKKNAPTVDLPKYNEYNYYFGVNFPKLRNTIAGDMQIWFYLIVILGVAVVFFVYAIFVIFNQKKLSEMQRDFINNMTHEFKTPIASINIAADVLSNPDSVNEQTRVITYGSIIKQEVSRLNEQVDKVLQIARIEKSGIQLHKESLDINDIINKLIENCKANYQHKIKITTHLLHDFPHVQADKTHVSNILYNLLDNAIKYAGENPEITIITEKKDKHYIISFADNGPGIKPEFHKRVFNKFYRVPTQNIHDVKGFGLGLFYVKSVCEAHGWKIYLDDKVLQGTRFIIEL